MSETLKRKASDPPHGQDQKAKKQKVKPDAKQAEATKEERDAYLAALKKEAISWIEPKIKEKMQEIKRLNQQKADIETHVKFLEARFQSLSSLSDTSEDIHKLYYTLWHGTPCRDDEIAQAAAITNLNDCALIAAQMKRDGVGTKHPLTAMFW